ncbi:hypothetical protein MJO29_008353 [Puccinia striiformis f. sp. tritici]|nr:hypothetical protein MJO29_008353 [Puccinia striiformis f. sp. tritici]
MHRQQAYPSIMEDRQDPSIEAAELNKDLRNRVHSNLFPILRHQIIIASRALDPINLSGEPLSTLQSILMIQSQLDHTLNQFPSALQRIGRVMSTLRSGRTNDQYLKEFKYFRGGGLFYLYTSRVIKELVKLFKQSYRLIRQMGLSFERNHDPTRIDATRQLILEHTSSACKEIDSAIEWLEGSEFDLVQWDWPSEISFTYNMLINTAETLFEHLNSALFLITLYVVPLVPDTIDSPVQNYFKTWFITWYNQFRLAIHQLEDASG